MPDASLWRRGTAAAIGLAALLAAIWYLAASESGVAEQYFCVGLALTLAFAAAVASGRPGTGMLFSGGLFGLICLAITFKQAYLQEPLLAPDLYYYANLQTLHVIAEYPTLLRRLIGALLVAGIALPVMWKLESPSPWRGRARRWQIPAALVAVLPLVSLLWPSGPARAIYAGDAWSFLQSARHDPVTGFVRSFARMRVILPDYRAAAADHYDWSDTDPVAPIAAVTKLPDIVAVLEESTLDPREWAACDIPECDARMFAPDARTAAHGPLEVHTYGGATWTSEFTFFAGLPNSLFGAAGVYAPYNLAPRMKDALPALLRKRGYRTVAVYPLPRRFVNADRAYAAYGFDAFYDSADLGLRWESTDAELFTDFERIYRKERAITDQPLFFMVLTMRQHGPHDYPLEHLPPPYAKPLFPTLGARANRNLGNYLYRLHESDLAMTGLEKFLLGGSRPAVLVHFGDHHPSFDGIEIKFARRVRTDLQPVAYALTYYMLKTNRPDPPRHAYEALDLAFLGSLTLDVAGVPKDAYFAANARLRERCAGRFLECPDQAALRSYYAEVFGRLGVFGD